MFNSKRIKQLEARVLAMESLLLNKTNVRTNPDKLPIDSINEDIATLQKDTEFFGSLWTNKMMHLLFSSYEIAVPRRIPINKVVRLILEHLKLEVSEAPETPAVPAKLILKKSAPVKPISSKRKK